MIPLPTGVRVWIATGHTDMRRGMNSLALLVQEALRRDPHGGDFYVFRGKSGKLIKILWHDGLGMSLYAKRLERGKFIWPATSAGTVSISAAQMAYCSKGSTGDIRSRPGGRRARAERIVLRRCAFWGIATHPICDSLRRMAADRQVTLNEAAALEQALATERAKALEVAAELAVARAKAAEHGELIAHQKLQIAKSQRHIYRPRSERSSRLIDQLTLTFEELEAGATEDELAAERAAAETTTVSRSLLINWRRSFRLEPSASEDRGTGFVTSDTVMTAVRAESLSCQNEDRTPKFTRTWE